MVECEYLSGGTCDIVARLTGCDRGICLVGEDACQACVACDKPRTLNKVTASIGMMVARQCQSGQELVAVRNRLSPAITVEATRPKPATGPGTELKKLLSWLGFKASQTCACGSHQREMDYKGVDWCTQNIDTIVGWLREEAEKQSLPFVEMPARALIRYAIRRAKK